MNKAILSVFVLAAAIITAVILWDVVGTKFPEWEFWRYLYVGLIVFGCGICLFISGILLEKAINDNRG